MRSSSVAGQRRAAAGARCSSSSTSSSSRRRHAAPPPPSLRASASTSSSRRLLAATTTAPAAARRRAGSATTTSSRAARLCVSASLDYVATASDEGVLKLPARTELDPEEVKSVFGYPRNLLDSYYLGRVIGAGSFGVVREGIEVATGRRLAVKTVAKVPKRGAPTPRYLLKLRTEVEVMEQLGLSLNAVHLHGVYEDDANIHMVMELCEGGALLDRVMGGTSGAAGAGAGNGLGGYSEAVISRLVRSILRFIGQCHAKGIIYRDVKPDNFLFLTAEPNSPLKATDFGLSIRHAPHEPKLTSRSGTPAYMAPELVMQCYDEKADIWSVGMLAYQLLTGRFPFWDDVRNETLSDVWKAILSAEIDWNAPELQGLSSSARDFLERLLQRNPVMRPSASEALEHPWLAVEGEATDMPLQGSVVQRLQRFATYSHLKQVVLRMITEDMRARGKAPSFGAALQDLFAQYDVDHSGTISFEELADGLRGQGYVVNESEVRQLMEKMDMDHDGNVGGDEFLATLIDWGQVMQEQEWQSYVDQAFNRMDLDGDGFIDLDELLSELPPAYFAAAVKHDNAAAAANNAAGGSGDGGGNGNAGSSGSNAGSSVASYEDERVAEAKRMLREADENGDGRISKQEFYNLLRDQVAPDSLSMYDDRLADSVKLKM